MNVAPSLASINGSTEIRARSDWAFSAFASDPGNDTLTYHWDFDGDGSDDFEGMSGTWAFSGGGLYSVGLRVEDGDGGIATGSFTVNVIPEPGSFALLLLSGVAALRPRGPRRPHGRG